MPDNSYKTFTVSHTIPHVSEIISRILIDERSFGTTKAVAEVAHRITESLGFKEVVMKGKGKEGGKC